MIGFKPVRVRVVLSAALIAAAVPAFAQKPSWAGSGKGEADTERREDNRDDDRDRGRKSAKQFEDRHRIAVRDYYGREFRRGHCPPGLAKKHNGCMPPGQAKKWALGQPLPRDVVIYEVPRALIVKIGVPPEGYRYVRVATDILLIAVGTKMVVDAIQDLGRN